MSAPTFPSSLLPVFTGYVGKRRVNVLNRKRWAPPPELAAALASMGLGYIPGYVGCARGLAEKQLHSDDENLTHDEESSFG